MLLIYRRQYTWTRSWFDLWRDAALYKKKQVWESQHSREKNWNSPNLSITLDVTLYYGTRNTDLRAFPLVRHAKNHYERMDGGTMFLEHDHYQSYVIAAKSKNLNTCLIGGRHINYNVFSLDFGLKMSQKKIIRKINHDNLALRQLVEIIRLVILVSFANQKFFRLSLRSWCIFVSVLFSAMHKPLEVFCFYL